MPNAYFTHLQDKPLALGLEVPYFFSGLHHGSDPAGHGPWTDAGRPNPWFTTEFWSVWYDRYGPRTPATPLTYDRRTWKIIAYGGNGYNYYMAHGGTNFGYTNNNEDAASYDYGAAVGQAGDLRPALLHLQARRLVRPQLRRRAGKQHATPPTPTRALRRTPQVASPPGKVPAGTIVFLDNPTATRRSKRRSPTAGGAAARLRPADAGGRRDHAGRAGLRRYCRGSRFIERRLRILGSCRRETRRRSSSTARTALREKCRLMCRPGTAITAGAPHSRSQAAGG